jgi:hypothetical protein
VNECGADGGPSVGARVVSCYHPIYPVVVLVTVLARVFTEQWNRQCGWYENKDLALEKRHVYEECLKRDLSTCCTKPRKQHAIKQENDTSNKVSIFSVLHRLHVDLFREQRVFVHEPVHAFPDYESEVP